MDFVSLLGAAGIGSVLTVLVQSWLVDKEKRELRSFSERKEAYVGLLQAYHRAAVEGGDEAAKEFAHWQMRCELVAPPSVI
ncbi:MAG: hypothetical protein ACPG1C_02875 [Alphaproteobacteria bacterium]